MRINKLTLAESKKQLNNQKERVSFTGKHYPSGYYEDIELEDARKIMNAHGDDWQKQFLKSMKKELNTKIGTQVDSMVTLATSVSDSKGGKATARAVMDVLTIGMAEVDHLWEKIDKRIYNNKFAKHHLEQIISLIPDLRAEDIEKAELSADKTNRQSKKLVALENEKQAIKNQLYKKFVDLTDLELKGNKVKMPNCIMLVGKSDDVPTELINWTKENADCNFVKVANEDKELLQDQLWDKLNEAKENFTKTKKRTLIHVEGFDSLINPTMNTFENIDGMKDIMQRCASDFGSTIIFKTKDPSKLNNEAIQPHRVNAWIDVRIKSVEELANEAPQQLIKKTEAIVKRLTEARAESRPMNVMNDFITLFAADERKTLKPGYTSYESRAIEATFKNLVSSSFFAEELNQGLKQVFDRALRMIIK